MSKDIKFCLVYRDMWQSSGKYMPRVDQLLQVAPAIIDMGCFSRVETNGGGFEQINLLAGENPNVAVREWTQPFNDVGIKTQMLERGLNGIRMSPVPADVRKLMFKVKKKQGTDISRTFDGLNNTQNLVSSFEFARDAGMIAQGAISLTHSPIHTVKYYINLADEYIKAGAQEICVKDMAGVGRPVSIGKIIHGIKKKHPKVLVQYHGHSTPGFSVASSLEAARAGADIIDVGMEPLSWGTGHADLLTIHAMLKDAGFKLPKINMDAYMYVRQLSQEFIDDFLGLYINSRNRYMNSLLLLSGLPGGMMGSLMADLEKNLKSLNHWLEKNGKEKMKQDELLIRLLKEVEYVWPMVGYPPLVTPYSQYVKNLALMNVIQLIKGRERWSLMDENTWGMLLGRSGKLPGELGEEIIQLAKSQEREFFKGNPADLYPNELEVYQQKMVEKGWDFGENKEELLEYAMHPLQYEDYKSGKAKRNFNMDLHERKAEKFAFKSAYAKSKSAIPLNVEEEQPKQFVVNVNGEDFRVQVSYDDDEEQGTQEATAKKDIPGTKTTSKTINAPLEGTFFQTREAGEIPVKIGDKIQEGDTIGYIESMKVINAISADKGGRVIEILARSGEELFEDDVILKLA